MIVTTAHFLVLPKESASTFAPGDMIMAHPITITTMTIIPTTENALSAFIAAPLQ
jgi:hypothetical protein